MNNIRLVKPKMPCWTIQHGDTEIEGVSSFYIYVQGTPYLPDGKLNSTDAIPSLYWKRPTVNGE